MTAADVIWSFIFCAVLLLPVPVPRRLQRALNRRSAPPVHPAGRPTND